MMPFDTPSARDLLDFYRDAGADALVGEEPIDRFAAVDAPTAPLALRDPAQERVQERVQERPPRAAALPAAGPQALASPDAAAVSARAAAKSAASLEELRAILETFEGCGLKATASRVVFGDGNPKARVMLVGEAPGRDEDIEGLPFVGRSGKLLDLMLAAIGLDRSTVYIANIVPWRPPGNRDPSPHESAICLPFILRQIELVDPDFLVCLGKPSMQTLLGIKEPITKARGRWVTFNTGQRDIRAIATFHPAFLLRSPLQKRFAWRDLLALKKALAG